MNAPSRDFVDILEIPSALALVFATNLFIGKEPTSPSDCVTLFDTEGLPPQINLSDQGYEFPSVQVRVRSTDYETGWSMMNAIKDELHGRAQETWNGTLYSSIYCGSGPAFLDWDDNSRARFICNFKIHRR